MPANRLTIASYSLVELVRANELLLGGAFEVHEEGGQVLVGEVWDAGGGDCFDELGLQRQKIQINKALLTGTH